MGRDKKFQTAMKILDNVPNMTLKSLYNTHWESRIKSVKAIRFQAPQIRLALFEVSKSCDDAKSKSETESLDTDCYPNASIAYRILLTTPVTVASTEMSFSKLKLLKVYLRSSMSQKRLNGLAILCIK
ncbi:unnamed protein product [Cuscuta epithymum]|uniref:HAT C-terminal dimerisation domain-containing protein n=1 Tax=Cuscuta epithymum TaxID=186058 RepID=A0AAV0F3G9_9ASTE|nr:unnamed protein product [Cuscuta epithymum]